MSKRKIAYSDTPEWVVFVSVYCEGHATDAGPSHSGEPWRITTYYLDPELPPWQDGSPRWNENSTAYTTAERKSLTFETTPTKVSLVGDRPISREEFRENPEVFEGGDSRSRYNLKCRTCGLTVATRDDRLHRALSALAALGVSEISLPALRATLTRA